MLDPTRDDALDRVAWAAAHGLRGICLFPAMHRYPLTSPDVARVFDLAAASPGTAVFVHCGVLSVGARKKLGLPSPFEMRFGNPLDLQGVALAHPRVPVDRSPLRRRAVPRGADAGRRPAPTCTSTRRARTPGCATRRD